MADNQIWGAPANFASKWGQLMHHQVPKQGNTFVSSEAWEILAFSCILTADEVCLWQIVKRRW